MGVNAIGKVLADKKDIVGKKYTHYNYRWLDMK